MTLQLCDSWALLTFQDELQCTRYWHSNCSKEATFKRRTRTFDAHKSAKKASKLNLIQSWKSQKTPGNNMWHTCSKSRNFCLDALCEEITKQKLCNGSSGRLYHNKIEDTSHYQSSNIYKLQECSQEALLTINGAKLKIAGHYRRLVLANSSDWILLDVRWSWEAPV